MTSDIHHPRADEISVHASALIVGERGALVRGPSGSGKSALCLAMIALARQSGDFAALVGDDRVFLRVVSDRVLARGVPGFEGLIERRGEGLLVEAHEPRAVVRLVVDLGAPPRWPEEDEKFALVLGARLPRLALDSRAGAFDGAYAALRGLARLA